jgi:amino acid adenylation domain-containing protein
MIAPLLDAATSLCCLDSEWDTIEAAAGHALRDDVRADHLCYVLYTSGSTGLPKGVLTEHRALVNQMHWRLCRYGLHADDVVLQKTPYSFDVSVWEFFWPLMVGAHLVVAAPGGHRDVAYLTRLIAERGVTTLHFVPSMVSMFLEHAAAPLPSVTHLFCGGEAMPRKIVDEVATVFPSAHLYNLYGPTEAAIDVTEYECEAEVPAVVPIGRPLHNTRLYIVDERHQPLPIGIPGELFIAGENLARGYLNRPELTEERFIPDPFVAGQRMYRSGDLARWHDDGTIEYLGRIDHQVKLRGLRIELGEIEACIETHEGVEKAVVVAQGDGADRRLVAFVRMAASADATGEALREHVLLRLPRHMVPSAFVGLVEWPVTTSGKTDRRVLERMEVAMDRVHQRVAPTTDDDHRMVAIWADVLGLPADAIGMDDDFFELGGHSLLAVRLMALVERAWHRALPLATLFTAPTVAALVRQLSETPPAQGVLVPIQPHGSQPPIFVVPGVGGNVLSFRAFATACGDDQPVYGLQATGLDGVTAPASSVRDAALINAQAILAASFVGPHRLLGHSFGGVVAFETARALMERGQSVESVALLDAFVQAPPDAIDEDAASEFHALCRQIGEWTGKVVDISVQALRETPPGAWTDLLAAAGLDVGTQQLEALRGVFEANRRAYAAYVPAPLPDAARVTLYRAARETRSADRYAPDHGWSAWLGYSPAIVDVDAGHFSMLDAPAAALVADAWRQIHRPSFNRK